MPMKTRDFGNTGLKVSEIGFGGSRIGGILSQVNGSNEALDVLRSALDAGINFYDTADMYSQGESETLIGTAFRKRRDQVILATKGGYCLPSRRKIIARIKPLVRPIINALGIKREKLSAGVAGAVSQDFTPTYLTRAAEASLRRLRTDYIDIYQLHSPSPAFIQSDMFGEALSTLETLKRQGKIRFYGIATDSPDDLTLCLSAPGISSVQLGFGLLDLEALSGRILSAASAKGIGIIARGCFGGGLLKEGQTETQLQAITPKWARILRLREISEGAGRPLLESALQFCLYTSSIAVTLLGMRTGDHLRENLKYYQAPPLTAEEYASLEQP
jgi:aryl-alcohol dehydrogenase-like predicted oxidoreductase